MSVKTQADEYLDEAKEFLSKAIDKLGRIVVDECDGHDDFNDAYRNELLAVYTELLRNRRRLNP